MIDPGRQLPVAPVADQDDAIGAQPVGDDRQREADAQEQPELPALLIRQMGEQGRDHDVGDQEPDAGAGFSDLVQPVGDLDHDPVMEDRDAGPPQQFDREAGGEVLQGRNQRIADRDHEEQESEGEDQPPRHRASEDEDEQPHQHPDQSHFLDRQHIARPPDQPAARHGGQRQQRQRLLPGRHPAEHVPPQPDQPQTDRQHEEAVVVGDVGPPRMDHGSGDIVEQRHQQGKQPSEPRQRPRPFRMGCPFFRLDDIGPLGHVPSTMRSSGASRLSQV